MVLTHGVNPIATAIGGHTKIQDDHGACADFRHVQRH